MKSLSVRGDAVESDRLWTPVFGWLTLAHFLQAIAASSMLLLPLYLSFLGATRAEVGTIMAMAAVGSLCVRPVGAWAIDRVGRKPTLIAGTIAIFVGTTLLLWAKDLGTMVYVSRLCLGLGAGVVFPAFVALASDNIPVFRRTEGLALFGVSGLIPMGFHPFADRLGIAPADIRWLIPLVGILMLVSLLPLLRVNEPLFERPLVKTTWGEVWDTLSSRMLWPVWLATIVFALCLGSVVSFAVISAKQRHIADAAMFWVTYALGGAGVRLFGGRLPDRVGPFNLVSPAFALYAAALLWLAFASTFGDVLGAGFLAGLGHGYGVPILSSMVISRSPEHLRGTALSAYAALWGISEILLLPVLGSFADHYGDRAMFVLVVLSGTCLLVLWAYWEHTHLHKKPPLLSSPSFPSHMAASAS